MTNEPGRSANFCYRHPDRQSYILCQRCGRTICPQCQTQAAVGVHCPECVKEARATAPRTRPAILTALRPGGSQPVVTWSLIAACVIVWVLQILPGSTITQQFLYFPPYTVIEPWRMITNLFLHSQGSFLHLGLNMFSLYLFGPMLERMLGRGRFLALYLLSGFGGSVAVLLISPNTAVLGASGSIFGLLAAFFVIQRKLGGNSVTLGVVIALNLVIGFLPGTNISWQAHVGGLVVGAAVAVIYLRTRRIDQKVIQIASLVGVFATLVAVTIVRVFVF